MNTLLITNEEWAYVNGENKQPIPVADHENSKKVVYAWRKADSKAKSDIILCISPSELKQVKHYNTSREVWLKLEGIYQSKGLDRKATLLKQLTLQRMEEGAVVRDHLRKFLDTVDKVNDMDVQINADLLAIMLLYSLPGSFENFRYTIESRDELPTPEILRIKIVEESDADARKGEIRRNAQDALFTRRKYNTHRQYGSSRNRGSENGGGGSGPRNMADGNESRNIVDKGSGQTGMHSNFDVVR